MPSSDRPTALPGAPFGARDVCAMVALVLLSSGTVLPWMAVPLTSTDHTAGVYYGLFAQCFERFGFWELRGMPLWPQLPATPYDAALYQNHPPGHFWLAGAFGTEEWQLRLPTVVGLGLATLAIYRLLRRSLAAGWAFGGALLFAQFPVSQLFCQASLELTVIPCGLWLVLATVRAGETTGALRTRWRIVQGLAAYFGPWMDWPFVWFCAALLPLVVRGGPRDWIRRLWLPATASLAALGSILAWRAWATANPRFNPDLETGHSVGELVEVTILARPEMSAVLRAGLEFSGIDFTVPALVAGALGVPVLLRRAPRVALALLLPGVLHVGTFAEHARIHLHFWYYFGPLWAVAAAHLAAAAARWMPRVVPGLALLVLAAAAGWQSQEQWRETSTTFYRDVGAVLTDASEVRGEDGTVVGDCVVAHNCPLLYTYYLTSHRVWLQPLTDSGLAARALGATAAPAVRYLWLRTDGPVDGGYLPAPTNPALERFLSGFPRTRVPELEVELRTHRGVRWRVREAWLYRLK